MSITVEIKPSLEAILRRKAGLEGVTIENYLLRLAEKDTNLDPCSDSVFDETIRKLETFRGKLGPVPESALDPELIYGDR